MQRMPIERHLAGEQRGLPASRQVQRDKQKIGNQREHQESHHFDGDVPSHQEDQIQYQHHAKTDQHANGGIHGHLFCQLLG